ncbi:MAG: hypothetical protein JWO97_768 [Acidobacteria bacterium]|nr:hypothetical protein [Acidobacteriota bacterium]
MNAKRKLLAATLFAALSIGHAATSRATVYMVPTDGKLIDSADAIVIANAGDGHGEYELNGDICTKTFLNVESVLKGTIKAGTIITTRELGGVVGQSAMAVSGGVTFTPGEHVLMFLQRDGDDNWKTWGMALGKFNFVQDAEGQTLLARDIKSEIFGFDEATGLPHEEKARMASEFIDFISRWQHHRVRGVAREDYIVEHATITSVAMTSGNPHTLVMVPNHHVPASSYTQGNFRWTVFDAGQTVSFRTSGSQPGYDSAGAAVRGAAAWTNDPNSNVRYSIAGTTTAGFVKDGQNTIVFNSSTDVPSGAIGYSKWFADGQHTFDNETWYSTSEGDVVMRSGLSISASAFDEAVTHELGHTLGFRHSDQGTPQSNQAVMNSVVSGNFGANLGPWDKDAVNHVYGNGTVVNGVPTGGTTCTAPAITTQPTSRTITAGQATTLSVGATGTTPAYQWYTGTSGTTTNPIPGATGPSVTVTPTTTTNYWVRVSNSCGTVNSATATVTVNPAPPPPPPAAAIRGDFNNDGNPDFIWRNSVTGANRLWLMNGVTPISAVTLPSVTDLNWEIAGAGDFNGDGQQDLVWRNYATGANAVWTMSGTSQIGSLNLPTVTDVAWHIESVNDFNHDGKADLLWRHYGTGANSIWLMNGVTLTTSVAINAVADTSWHIAGSGDTNSDGAEDIVWRNFSNGQTVVWFMTGTNSATLKATTSLSTITDQTWQIGAVSSFTNDPVADLVWRHYADGQDAIWVFGGGQVGFTTYSAYETDLSWKLVGPR